MKQFESGPVQEYKVEEYKKRISVFANEAANMPEIQEAIENAGGKMNAIREVRHLLSADPSVSDIERPKNDEGEELVSQSNDFWAAKEIVDALYKDKESGTLPNEQE